MKKLLKKYNHILILFCFLVLYIWYYLIQHYTQTVWFVHCPLDDIIPYCQWFIIWYFVWYLYISLPLIWFFFKSRTDFLRMAVFLFLGMGFCHLIYTLVPNAIDFRPAVGDIEGNGLTAFLVRFIYNFDMPRNVFPSLHCFESAAIHITMCHSDTGRKIKWLRPVSLFITVMICASTVFVKQHSVLDVLGGVVLALPIYFIVYKPDWKLFRPADRDGSADAL